MMTEFDASLISFYTIKVDLNKNLNFSNISYVRVFKNSECLSFELEKNDNSSFFIHLSSQYDFQSCYFVSFNNIAVRVKTKNAASFEQFDSLFNYEGNDLGLTFKNEQIIFKIWTPISKSVNLKISKDHENFELISMIYDGKGVFKAAISNDYYGAIYHYINDIDGEINEFNDPYGKFVNFNSEFSAVYSLDDLKCIPKIVPKTSFNLLNSLIYELNVRDFTEGEHTNIKNKGKYLGLVEENRKTTKNNPAGLDYLINLGITHVQLMPIIDFRGVDDIDNNETYNWGYDPISFFALEGSYSNYPEHPLSRLLEFKKVISEFHKHNIRVIIDVVFNHAYKFENSSLEKSMPNYFFRKHQNGVLSNASGCGNDFASERYMARKIMIQSAKYFIENFDVDGFRFDLMGLHDVKTMDILKDECKAIKSDLMFYGEGWDMPTALENNQKSSIKNAKLLPDYSFFNDFYRDILKGPNFKNEISKKGFINGDYNYFYGFDFVWHSCILNHSYEPIFDRPSQSINYIECHDNNTLFDKLTFSNKEEDYDVYYERIKLANSLLVYSLGIPFIHMGQEIGLSKNGHENSYNVPKINNMDWLLVDKNFEMVESLKESIKIRNNVLKYTQINDKEVIKDMFQFEKWDNNVIYVGLKSAKTFTSYNKFFYLINVENASKEFNFDDVYNVLINSEGDKKEMKSGILSPCSVNIFVKD